MTDTEIRQIATAAAKEAVKEVFSILRVDPTDIDSVTSFMDDQRYVRRQREAAEKISMKAVFGVFTIVATGLSTILWLGLQDLFTR